MEITSVKSFLEYYQKIWNRTLRVTKTIPQDKIHWRPNDSAFSFADILTHLTNLERFMFAETVINNVNRYPGHENGKTENFTTLLGNWKDTFQRTFEMISQLKNNQLEDRCTTPDGASIRIWKWLRAMIEHHIHHRGQIYTYLKLIKIESPSLYGLTSEQVKDRSM